MKKSLILKLGVLITVAVLAGVFFSRGALALSDPGVRHGQVIDQPAGQNYLSPEFGADFNFGLIGASWDSDTPLPLEVRFYNSTGWSDWIKSESEDYYTKNGWSFITEPILANQASRFQYRLSGVSPASQVKIIYVDSVNVGPAEKINPGGILRTAGSASIFINRAGWQADESWRLNSAGQQSWQPEYKQPQKFIIHHTAGDSGGADPAAVIRGIYYWHAVVLGWGDIGYNYLIDQEGRIYEGRYGGDGVIGGHAYRSATCASQRFGGADKEASFNDGTIGIAVLGNYSGTLELNDAVRKALADLIGQKAIEFGVAPSGSSYFIDNTYPNVIGHRDVDCTDCPGMHIYDQLEGIRQSAQQFFASAAKTEPVARAAFISQSDQPLSINAGEIKEIWVDFRNDGNFTWHNFSTQKLAVASTNQVSDFYVAGWNSVTEVARLSTPNVAPGEVGRFVFTIKAPTDRLEWSEQFTLQLNSQTLEGTTFTVSANITGFAYAAKLDTQEIRPATLATARQTVTMRIKNRGLQTWQKGKVKLSIYDLGNKVSRFRDSSWPDQYGQVTFQEAEVKTNGLATFTFRMQSPAEPGLFRNEFRLVGNEEFIQNDIVNITRVDPQYQAQLVSNNIPPALLNIWRFPTVIRFKNTGGVSWDQQTVLKVFDLGGRTSRFRDRTWLDNATAARLQEKSVAPGQTGTFSFRLDAPNAGLYLNSFVLNRGATEVAGSYFSIITRVD